MVEPLLFVKNLAVRYPANRKTGILPGNQHSIQAVDGVDLEIHRGEVLGLVGESGSGKTTLGRAILRLVPASEGQVRFDGIDILSLDEKSFRPLRRRMQIIFQDPYNSLNPRMRAGQIIAEPLEVHRLLPAAQVPGKVEELLSRVGLDKEAASRYPHEFSGGQRQRIAIARALSLEPDFLVADEPVSALDVSIQAQILNLLLELQSSQNLTMLLISHDIAVVQRLADRIAVMYRGRIVEQAPTDRLLDAPNHPYTQRLLDSVIEL